MNDTCWGLACKQKGENVYCGADLCSKCSTKLVDACGGRWKYDDPDCIIELVKIIRPPFRQPYIEELATIRKNKKASGTTRKKAIKKTSSETTKRVVKKKTESKKEEPTPAEKAVTKIKRPVTRKKSNEAPRKKVSNREKLATSAKKVNRGIKRREVKGSDDVAENLLQFENIPDMVEWARGHEEVNHEKLDAVLRDYKNGSQMGLLRMRVANLVRGALGRAARKEATGKTKIRRPTKTS